jgi:hypothetical protein
MALGESRKPGQPMPVSVVTLWQGFAAQEGRRRLPSQWEGSHFRDMRVWVSKRALLYTGF